ncbi:MAG: hypothetical protein IJ262_06300 [Clostridia bacterium]|nr:hypothetical protein [Clostridia bacterium]
MMKKRFLFVAAAVCLVFLFSSCSKGNSAPVTVENESISSGVFAYYLDKIMSYPEDYDADLKNTQQLFEKAATLCSYHAAANSIMKEEKISLSHSGKADIAAETESEWSLFGEYYKSIGISKPDLTEINTFEEKKEQLVEYYYGADGKNAVSDDDLKQKFVEMYIGFKAFEGSFTKTNIKGETVPMTEKEKEALIADFRKMADKINEGASIDSVYEDYCVSQGLIAISSPEVILMKDKDPMYADDFFKKVSTISHSKAAPVTSGSSVYVVQRVTIATSDEDAFEQYRSTVLQEMKMPAVEKKISSVAKKSKVETNEKILSEIYDSVSTKHSNQEK